jgi:hypothetical protein
MVYFFWTSVDAEDIRVKYAISELNVEASHVSGFEPFSVHSTTESVVMKSAISVELSSKDDIEVILFETVHNLVMW